MAFKLRDTLGNNKAYLRCIAGFGMRGSQHWEYVTPDAALTVEACGYIVTTTADGAEAYGMLSVGDIVWVFTVAAIVDTRTIEADKAAGITGIEAVAVVRKDADVVELSAPLFGTSAVSYTS